MTQEYIEDPEAWLEHVTTNNDFVAIVIFRGHWCPHDEQYLKALGVFYKTTMEEEGLKMIAWTSEGSEGAAKADALWGLTKNYGFSQVLGDSTNALANWLKEDELLPHLVTATPTQAHVKDLVDRNGPGSYPNGMVQPGMVWYAHHGSLALQWESRFEAPHYGSANRPQPSEIWAHVLKRKHALDSGNAIMPVHGNALPVM